MRSRRNLFVVPLALLLGSILFLACDPDAGEDTGGGTTALTAAILPLKAEAAGNDYRVFVIFNKPLHPDNVATKTAADIVEFLSVSGTTEAKPSGPSLTPKSVSFNNFGPGAMLAIILPDNTALKSDNYVYLELKGANITDRAGNALSTPILTAKIDGTEPTLESVSSRNKSDGTAGKLEQGDQIVLVFSEEMGTEEMGKVYNVTGDGNAVSVHIFKGATDTSDKVATFNVSKNPAASGSGNALHFNDSKGVWSDDGKTLTITLAAKSSDGVDSATDIGAATGDSGKPAAGPAAEDTVGNTAATTAAANHATIKF